MVENEAGDLVFEAPSSAYAGIAGWRTKATWLQAFRIHPRAGEAARRYETCVQALHLVVELVASRYADPVTGRGIAVAHATIAKHLGISAKKVQRCLWAAEDLGLLVRVLDGSDMSLQMRMQVRDHYGHHDQPVPRPDGPARRRGTRSKLPNVYAATLPRWLATQLPGIRPKPARGTHYAAATVDNLQAFSSDKLGFVHPPVGATAHTAPRLVPHSGTTTFNTICGKAQGLEPTADTTAAARPTTTHRKTGTGRAPRRLDPAVEAFARAFKRDLVGFWDVSLHRICPALSSYVSAGLSVSDLQRGLNDYLAATGRTWRTHWRADQSEDQARYLIGMLKRARQAGYLPLPHDDEPEPFSWLWS